MNTTDYNKFLTQLERHEGKRLTAYLDTQGILTVGIGHNCLSSPVKGVKGIGDSITPEYCAELFKKDVDDHVKALEATLPWVKDLDPIRQAVLYNLQYNLGMKGLLGFKNTLEFVRKGDYESAARGMLQSKWATQVKGRATELSEQMRTGQWQKI